MRILHVAHQQWRNYGDTRVSWAQKLLHGLIRCGYQVRPFGDRDTAAFLAPLGIRQLGERAANRALLQTVEAYQPDLVIVGHCPAITNTTLEAMRHRCPDVTIAVCNNDPLFVPENAARIAQRCTVADAIFVSTGAPELRRFTGQRARLWHMPNPVDPAVERADCSQRETFDHDLLFCSKSNDLTERGKLVAGLREALAGELRFHTPGSFGVPGVWGHHYDDTLAVSKMGLNLNRQEGWHWYASARMAQMGGNGLLLFTHADAHFDSLFPEETLVYFRELEDLKRAVMRFHHDDDLRRHYAANTRHFFHTEMNIDLYARYIVEASLGLHWSHDYAWLEHARA